jgi:hypothetical protein
LSFTDRSAQEPKTEPRVRLRKTVAKTLRRSARSGDGRTWLRPEKDAEGERRGHRSPKTAATNAKSG